MDLILNFQADLSARILKAYSNFKKSPKDRITKQYIETRSESIDQLWLEFLTGHKELLRSVLSEDLRKTKYVTNETYDTTEEAYMDYKCALKSAMLAFDSVESSGSVECTAKTSSTSSSRVMLPKINIPVFSGKYSEWPTFRDLFRSLVHCNQDLDGVQKLHYLKGYLQGEAEQLLRNIPIADDNYGRCWQILEERYNNKKYICHHILSRLFGLKSLTNESAVALKVLIDTTNDCLSALSNLCVETESWDVIIIHLLTTRLDHESRRQWEFTVMNSTSPNTLPTYKQFSEFITNRYRAIEFLDPRSNASNRSQNSNNHPPVNRVKSLHVTANLKCIFCQGDHRLSSCKEFIKDSVESRREYVLKNKLCFVCLGGNHSAKFCRTNFTCRICKRKHHSLLHPKGIGNNPDGINKDGSNTGDTNVSNIATAKLTDDPIISCFSTGRVCDQVLLATALVKTLSKNGESFMIRALLDQGSQSSFVTESVVQQLGLKKIPVRGKITGIGGDNSLISKAMVSMEITSRIDSRCVIKVNAYVLKSITTLLPATKVDSICWTEFNNLVLADPKYHTPNRIDVLLGAEVYGEVIQDGVRKASLGSPIAQSTTLGWILSGVVKTSTNNNDRDIKVMHCRVDDNDLLKRFWELESDNFESLERVLRDDERRCEEYFAATTRKDAEGRYIVRLPFNQDKPQVTDSYKIAEKRLRSLEYRLSKNERLKHTYSEVINEYLELNHMELVPDTEKDNPKAIYLPHHAVIREDKETSKVRVVFDASCKGSNGKSLNDNSLVGPTLQSDLRHIIMRWRVHPICLTADIVKMYRQIKIDERDIDYQRILWRDNTAAEIKHYRLLRVTFGTASAPYLAVKALQQTSLDDDGEHPMVSERVLTDFYMDDLLSGCQSKEEGLAVYREMTDLLARAGFELQKWSSNSDELLQDIQNYMVKPEIGKEVKEEITYETVPGTLKIKTDEIIKIVGLTWNRSDDSFHYVVQLPALEEPVTKRKIISVISRFYDPLGWVGPSIIVSKCIIQKLWLAGIDWDEVVPKNILEEWLTYRQELKLLVNIQIPRWTGVRSSDALVELHGFCDASKVAYAAVVYVRATAFDNTVRTALISAKTKVAPVKQVSIPRLELCGAVLLTRLLVEVARILQVSKINIHAWTDSTVVLAWLNSHSCRWKVFVANRVSEIQTSLDPHNWSHVTSKQNPADGASRGLPPSQLIDNANWFQGPDFLREDTIRYQKPKDISTDIEEVRVLCATTVVDDVINRFSSLTRMVRVLAYCRRFVHNIRDINKSNGHLTTNELNYALNQVILQCQVDNFSEERAMVMQNKNLPKRNCLRSLNPYVDEDQLLRIGGRLEHSQLSFGQKHPIILPKNSHLTDLIVSDSHKQTLHGGPQLMMRYILSKYWILGGKQKIKAYYRKCVICAKNSAVVSNQLMGQLPSERVTPMRPFKLSGVDYAGPLQIRTAKGRGHKSYKGYICLFVCLSTRAIHLEVVTDLTSDGFLQAFKRFVARRGHCSDLWSDNATNFVGASNELRRLQLDEQRAMLDEVAEQLATKGCNWHFIPARSPNFGGLWEAGVKSVKHHLKRIVGQSTLTYEELATVLVQVEACLNSRPISALTDDTDGASVLTAGHFLVGEPLILPPDRNYETSSVGSLRRWQYTQRMLQDFWRVWSREYLLKFFHRYRWASQTPNFNIGDVVLVKEDDLPP